jgi:hypothetical protein
MDIAGRIDCRMIAGCIDRVLQEGIVDGSMDGLLKRLLDGSLNAIQDSLIAGCLAGRNARWIRWLGS